jgi:hypothetical protein
MAILDHARATLSDSTHTSASEKSLITAEVIGAMDAWDVFEAFAASPSLDSFYRLPRPVRLALGFDKVERCQPPMTDHNPSAIPIVDSWMQCLSSPTQPPLP